MPILAREERLTLALMRELGSIGEKTKPVICVLGGRLWGFRRPIFYNALGDLSKDFYIHSFVSFSRPQIINGGMGEGVSPASIATLRPVLLISELVIAPYVPGDSTFGLKMLRNVRSNEGLKKVPLFIISTKAAFKRTPRGSFTGLGVQRTFTWEELSRQDSTERERLFSAVSDILISSFGPRCLY